MKEDNNRTVKISFRITEKELVNLETAMALENYRSRSKYIRHLLSGQKVVRRNLRPTDENLVKQAMILSDGIRKIGVNYNQIVRALNTAVGLRDKNGRPLLSVRRLENQLAELHSQMEKIVSLMQEFMGSVRQQLQHIFCSTIFNNLNFNQHAKHFSYRKPRL